MECYRVLTIILLTLAICPTAMIATGSADSDRDELFGFQKKYENVLVARVVGADTIILENDERIRLIGLTVPNPPKKTALKKDKFGFPIEEFNPTTPIEEQALNFTKDLLEGQAVRLEFDEEQKNDNLETLAYVFLKDGTLANAEILRAGFANLKIVLPNTKYSQQLRSAYQEAKREKRGLQGE